MRLHIACESRVGIAREVLEIMEKHGIDLYGIEADAEGQIYLNFPDLEFDTFRDIMPQLRMISGVTDVSTVPYMPLEREQQEMNTLLRALPEPIISIDTKGDIVLANNAALRVLKLTSDQAKGSPIKQWLKGFNIHKWLEQKDRGAQTSFMQLKSVTYLCDVMPIAVPEKSETGEPVQAGAVLTFKSPERLGRQMTAFQKTSGEFDMVVAESSAMKTLVRQAKKVSQLDAPILIIGEAGTGKELLAKSCHEHSLRRDKSFYVISCQGIEQSQIDQQLFATEPDDGLIRKATGGTLMIDGIEFMDIPVQKKLLAFLQKQGSGQDAGTSESNLTTRIICSTAADLLQMCDDGVFIEDLYYRLNVLSLHIPRLQERRSDILVLAEQFISRFTESEGRFISISDSCKNALLNYAWPGNVRQLRNVLMRAVTVLDGDVLEEEHLQLPRQSTNQSMNFQLEEEFEGSLDSAVKTFEAELLRRLYPSYPSSRQLGKKLGVSHTAIANKLRDYGIGRSHQKKRKKIPAGR